MSLRIAVVLGSELQRSIYGLQQQQSEKVFGRRTVYYYLGS